MTKNLRTRLESLLLQAMEAAVVLAPDVKITGRRFLMVAVVVTEEAFTSKHQTDFQTYMNLGELISKEIMENTVKDIKDTAMMVKTLDLACLWEQKFT